MAKAGDTLVVVDRVAEAQARAEAARVQMNDANAAFSGVSDRIRRGEDVTGPEFGDAEMALRLAITRARIANEKADAEVEAQRRARIGGFGNYAEKQLDRTGFDRAQVAFRAAAVALFREMDEYNGQLADLETELVGLLAPDAAKGGSHTFSHGARLGGSTGGFEASGKSFARINPESGVQFVLREAYQEVFPRSGYPY